MHHKIPRVTRVLATNTNGPSECNLRKCTEILYKLIRSVRGLLIVNIANEKSIEQACESTKELRSTSKRYKDHAMRMPHSIGTTTTLLLHYFRTL